MLTVLNQTLDIATRTSYNLPGKVMGLLPIKVVEDRLLLYFVTEVDSTDTAQDCETTTALDIVIVGTGEALPEDFPTDYVYLGTEILATGYVVHCYARLYTVEITDCSEKKDGTEPVSTESDK